MEPRQFAPLLRQLADPEVGNSRRVESLFLATLGRLPDENEMKQAQGMLSRAGDPRAGLEMLLIWLTSTGEFGPPSRSCTAA